MLQRQRLLLLLLHGKPSALSSRRLPLRVPSSLSASMRCRTPLQQSRRCVHTSSDHNSSSSADDARASTAAAAYNVDDVDKYDLGLDFARIDFDKVAVRTQQAMQSSRRSNNSSNNNGSDKTQKQPHDTLASATQHETTQQQQQHVQCDDDVYVYSDNSSGTSSSSSLRALSHALTDTLRDCALTGSWAKAYRLFDEELHKACEHVRRRAAATATTQEQTRDDDDDAHMDEAACLAAMQRMLAAAADTPTTHTSSNVVDSNDTNTTTTTTRTDDEAVATTGGGDDDVLRKARALVASCAAPAGLLQWHSIDCYLLLKTLVQAERVDEVARVWRVLEGSGMARYRFAPRTVNALLSLLLLPPHRRHRSGAGAATSAMATPIHVRSRHRRGTRDATHSTERGHDSGNNDSGKDNSSSDSSRRRDDVYGEVVRSLEALARDAAVTLNARNDRATRSARLAAALQHAQPPREQQQDDGNSNSSGNDSNKSSHSISEAVAHGLRVGDFNALLRRARGEREVQRIVQMMRSVGVDMDAASYAAVLTALHAPTFALDKTSSNDKNNVNNDNNNNNTGNDDNKGQDDNDNDKDARDAYEQHKQRRVALACVWFAACPVAQRTAHVYNALLYLLRGRQHAALFDDVLTQWRGNAVRPPDVNAALWRRAAAKADAAAATSNNDNNDDSNTSGDADGVDVDAALSQPLLPPQWTVRPNGKTYELLIQRARYLHDWQAMWALYDEMRNGVVVVSTTAPRDGNDANGDDDNAGSNDTGDAHGASRTRRGGRLRGTPRLYEMLLSEATTHPPPSPSSSSSTATTASAQATRKPKDASALVLQLYADMRDSSLDVTTPTSTVSVLNAWCNTRTRRRWC